MKKRFFPLDTKKYRIFVRNLRLYARWNDAWYHDAGAYHSILDPILAEMTSTMVDGVLYIAGHARIIDCFPENYPIPAVMAYAYNKNRQVPSIVIDDELSAYQLINYLIGQGYRRIGMIAGRMDNIHTQRRLTGYQKALYKAGIPFNPEWIRYGNWDMESGYREAKPLLDAGLSAIFCCCDRTAVFLRYRKFIRLIFINGKLPAIRSPAAARGIRKRAPLRYREA